LQQRLPYRAEQEGIEPCRMGGCYGGQLVWHAEDHMEILDGEQFLGPFREPGRPRTPLTLGTVPVAGWETATPGCGASSRTDAVR
jgi:hypothetical protein